MLGGVVIFCAFFSICLISGNTDKLLPLFIASLPIIIAGVYDDLNGMTASQKLFVQFVSSIVIISFGIVITQARIPFSPLLKLGIFSIPTTICWFILMSNLMNIIDGLDGLASGLAGITLFTLLFFARDACVASQILILLGAVSGFLLLNFNPAKIFLGNNGSTFLGFAIAYLALTTSQKSTIIPILALPCVVLVIHLADIVYAILRRAKNKKNIFKGDKKHIHHMILNATKNHKCTVFMFYAISLALAFLIVRLTK